jgi:hypothetical protein
MGLLPKLDVMETLQKPSRNDEKSTWMILSRGTEVHTERT